MRRIFYILLFLLPLSLSFPLLGGAVLPDEVLEDEVLEAEARDISRLLRCVVCENQTIDASRSPLARDLRILVRERLLAGDDRDEVLDYISARYGDYVLLSPRFRSAGILLWLSLPLVFLLGVIILWFYYRRRLGGH